MTGSEPFGFVLQDTSGAPQTRRGRIVLYRTERDARVALTLKTTVAGVPTGALRPEPVYLKPKD